MDFVVFSLGCRVNQSEGMSMVSRLVEYGYSATDKLVKADYYIINSCSVTGEADRKSRQAVARAKALNPSAKVFVCGCSSQNDPKPFLAKDGVISVSGVGGKMDFLDKITSYVSHKIDFSPCLDMSIPRSYEDYALPTLTQSRAFIKVQDGCDNFCSYCIIPYLRGRSRSRSIESILSEAKTLETKTREIVITGINVSAYGKDSGSSLTELVERLGEVRIRKRFASIECNVIDKNLLYTMKNNGWCDSFHLSMQSGSDGVLRRMNRRYTKQEYLDKVSLIRSVFPDAGITTDVIAGFPGETESEFLETLATCKAAGFSGMHVFPYSEREGTVAAKYDQIPVSIRKERARRLIDLGEELRADFLKGQKGKRHEVFIEENAGELNVGYTDNFIKVYCAAPVSSMAKITVGELYADGVKGELV
jgi:threonylcarbamoyladenosine tRNA methylthiotransferase MtaB